MASASISMVTATVTATITAASPSSTLRALPQGGILEGGNPSLYDPKNPLTIFIIQAGIIIVFCRLLHYPLSRLQQPRVIAEVIGGILLGPSVMGHIPGFTSAIFPAASMPTLTMAANLGLVLFLFLVGLEVDLRFLVSNWRIALSVGTLGMALPFGLGIAIAYGLYHQFSSEPGTVPVNFGVYILFVGVAMAITAFPVLCRILTELKLLSTPVGIIVLSAGVGNDVVGWILLALCVALVNAGSGIVALYVLLCAVGYTLFLVYAVRPGFMWVLRRTGSLQNGPTQSVVALTALMVLCSAFFTSIIGIHPIFGAFLVGVVCPHEGGFAIKVAEKIEDLVSVLLLPLYFALSGLSTNLGLLNDGITWAYVIGVICVAFFAKVIGGTLAARFNGLVWRESFTIGVLMSCKGLVELIVLNIGLQAKILSTRTFTIFVVMALVTTFATTPLVKYLYPHDYQVKLNAWKRGEIDWNGGEMPNTRDGSEKDLDSKSETVEVTKMLAYLRLDCMSGVMGLISLLAIPVEVPGIPRKHPSKDDNQSPDAAISPKRALQVQGVRLAELTERESSVMRVSEMDDYSQRDPVVNAFCTFGQIKNVAVGGSLLIASEANYATTLTERATQSAAQLLLLPWSETGAMSEDTSLAYNENQNPSARFTNGVFSSFILTALSRRTCPAAIFVDNGFGSRFRTPRQALSRTVSTISARDLARPSATNSDVTFPPSIQGHHIFMPFFGSEDDKLALRLVLQLAQDPTVTATIVLFELDRSQSAQLEMNTTPLSPNATNDRWSSATATAASAATAAPAATTTFSQHATFFATLRNSLPASLIDRVLFETVSPGASSGAFASTVVSRAKAEVKGKGAGDLIVLGQNRALEPVLRNEGGSPLGADAANALGDVVGGLVRERVGGSYLVIAA